METPHGKTPNPCALCGYHAPHRDCPHCHHAPPEASLRPPLAGPMGGIGLGFMALPQGLRFLFSTPKVKRWLIPPLILTFTILFAVLYWGWGALDQALSGALPENFELPPPDWDWIERWGWVQATFAGLMTAVEWLVNSSWGLITNRALTGVVYFMAGILASWYVFSIAYEAFAGPFLDEIQGRIETRWFGLDPRSSIERPTNIPVETCVRLSIIASVIALGLVIAALFMGAGLWVLVLLVPLPFFALALQNRPYGNWLYWVAQVESRAIAASIKASIVTGLLLLLALPLYFFPGLGYFMFALVAGFATSVGLLDIPMERRGWSFRQRIRFVFGQLPALCAFGAVSGLLLSIPIIGAVLMVPAASLGGLWLLVRLDKGNLRSPSESPKIP